MSELDDLEQALREAGGVWFRDDLLLKLERLFEIARAGEAALTFLQIAAPGQRIILGMTEKQQS